MMSPAADHHLTSDETAAYLDRQLQGAGRDRVEAHLADCAECRSHVVVVHGILTTNRRPQRRMIGAGLIAAAAAAMLLVVTQTNGSPGVSPHAPALRGVAEAPRLTVYGPNGETDGKPLRFVWGAWPGALSYRLTVTGANGEKLWSRDGADTAVALPETVILENGATYFWVVDALLSDGGAMTTGLREFTPVP